MTHAEAPAAFVIDGDAVVPASIQGVLRSADIPQISGFSSASLRRSTERTEVPEDVWVRSFELGEIAVVLRGRLISN